MRIISWNINSLCARLNILAKITKDLNPDFILLQETKVQNHLFPIKEIKDLGFNYLYFDGEKSYNGVAILAKNRCELISNENFCINKQKRHLHLQINSEIGLINLHNFYIPAGGEVPDLKINPKFFHKIDFLERMSFFFDKAKQEKSLSIIAGDFNIAPLESDVWSHSALKNTVSHTAIEIEKLNNIKNIGKFIDSHRYIYGEEKKLYSWWSYRSPQPMISNRGRRLDHIWITSDLSKHLSRADFFNQYRQLNRPSDHIPISIDLSINSY